jgi:hypothetical protein
LRVSAQPASNVIPLIRVRVGRKGYGTATKVACRSWRGLRLSGIRGVSARMTPPDQSRSFLGRP